MAKKANNYPEFLQIKISVAVAIVQVIVGHASPAMTKHYTHIGSETLKTAINALPVANYNHEETNQWYEPQGKLDPISRQA